MRRCLGPVHASRTYEGSWYVWFVFLGKWRGFPLRNPMHIDRAGWWYVTLAACLLWASWYMKHGIDPGRPLGAEALGWLAYGFGYALGAMALVCRTFALPDDIASRASTTGEVDELHRHSGSRRYLRARARHKPISR